jgi:hypothetical protein
MSRLREQDDSPIIAPILCRWGQPGQGAPVRILLGMAVIAVGIANLCFAHRWHRVLGVVAIALGVGLCALVWFR